LLTQPVNSEGLEAMEAKGARLITKPYVARDTNDVPIIGYFPGALPAFTVNKTFDALSSYIGEVAESKTKCAEKRAEKDSKNQQAFNEPDSDPADDPYEANKTSDNPSEPDEPDESDDWDVEPSTWPGYNDHRHPPNPVLLLKYGFQYALLHLGIWLATGHPYDPPVISSQFRGSAISLSRGYRLFKALEHLTTELSIIFAAFDPFAWSRARTFRAALGHFFPETTICQVGEFDCWAHRAFLFNQQTRAHRDVRDDRFGYAVIAVTDKAQGYRI
jgi:hypothetical protein